MKKKIKPIKASHQFRSPKGRQRNTRFKRYFLSLSPCRRLCDILLSLLLFDLEQQGAVDGRKHTTKGDGGTDQSVELLVTTDGELQVTGRDALDLEILCGVACELEDFGRQVFEDRRDVDGRLCGDAHLVLRVRLEKTLDTTAGEL